jgi:hypothetical protein
MKIINGNNIDLGFSNWVDYIKKRYEVCSNGSVFNKKTKKQLKFFPDPKGYMKARMYCPEISLHSDCRKIVKLHRLIAACFLDNYSDSLQVNHINGIKTDNRIENLEMVTNSQNAFHAWNILDSKERKSKIQRCTSGKFIKRI